MLQNDGSGIIGGALEKKFWLTTLWGATGGKNENCSNIYQNDRNNL